MADLPATAPAIVVTEPGGPDNEPTARSLTGLEMGQGGRRDGEIDEDIGVLQRDPEVFRYCGMDPEKIDILVVKSAVHFRAAFAPLAGAIVEADGPGLTALDLKPFPFKRIRRPIYPLDEI